MALVTAAQVRAAAVPELAGTSEDTFLDSLIARADAALASWCGYPQCSTGRRTLESATYTLYLRGLSERPRILPLPFTASRVTSVTSIYDDPALDWESDTLVSSSDYTVRATEGDVLLKSTASTLSAWTHSPPGSVKVTLVAGWTAAAGANPAELEVVQAIILLVQHWLRLRSEGGHSSVSVQGVSVSVRDEDIPVSVAQLMQPYRLIGPFL